MSTSAADGFDHVVVVDWSANATPKRGKDSIWVGLVDADGTRHEPVNPTTRAAAMHLVADLVTGHAAAGERTLVGLDFPLGYPAGFAAAAGLVAAGGSPWAATWHHLATALTDEANNANNRWEVAADLNERLGTPHFWGAPPRRSGPHLPCRKPAADTLCLPAFRRAEEALRAGRLRPFSVWQLLGAGSVGSQALTGIAALWHLQRLLAARTSVQIWPFETGLAMPTAPVVLAEIWPSMLPNDVIDRVAHPVKDARQVTALAAEIRAAGHDGRLARWFAVPSAAADPTSAAAVVAEEGWVLGLE